MDFRQTFIDFTQWVVPQGYEETVAHLLPAGCEKDEKGNYSLTIGESETLFTCHLDTVSHRAKVNHVFDGDWIKTDGTTILGGDNKAGVCILMYLIEQQVPGTYYFFVAEECGRLGSKWALEHNKEYFSKFKRAIAFDRRNQGSIITHQSSRLCASPEFTDALSKEFSKSELEYKGDSGGSFTDTYTFIDTISECTNLSAGVVGEHTTAEKVNIVHLEKVAIAASKIEWEKLPSNRDITKKEWKSYGNYNHNNYNHNYYDEYEDYFFSSPIKKEIKKIAPSESGLEFNISNITKFFNLTIVKDGEDIYYTTKNKKRNFYFTIDSTIAVEEDLGQVYPYFVQHYIRKNAITDDVPTSFEQLWRAIKDLDLDFTPIDNQSEIPFYVNNICSYFDLEICFDENGSRIYTDKLTLRDFQIEIEDNWIVIWEHINAEPYVKTLFTGPNKYKSFAELWIAIRSCVPFRRYGKMENPFYNGSTINFVDASEDKIPLTSKNITNYFNLIKDNGNGYYKTLNGNATYFFEISSNHKVHLWRKNEGGPSFLNNDYVKSFDDLWSKIKGKVEFQPRENLDEVISKMKTELPFKIENIDKFFDLSKKEVSNMGQTKDMYFISENKTSYFFKILDEDDDSYDGEVYLVNLDVQTGRDTHVIVNYSKFSGFEELWENIKDKVDFKKRTFDVKPIEKREKQTLYKKVEFKNENISEFFNLRLINIRGSHYVTEDDNKTQYYFDILDDNKVFVWERTTGINSKFNTIIDGTEYDSFEDIWIDIRAHVKFKPKEIAYTQDNVTMYFNLVANLNKCFYTDKSTNENYFIFCGKSKNKVVVKSIEYKKELSEKGLKVIDKMHNLYMGSSENIQSFDELWEAIKDVVPFKKRGL